MDSDIVAWMECVKWTLSGRYCTAGGQWYCDMNGVRYSEHYLEVTSQQLDTGIAAWMKCVTINIIWKKLHSRGTAILQFNEICYSEHYLDGTSQQVNSGISAWMNCVTVNRLIFPKFLPNKVSCTTGYFLSTLHVILHSKYTLNSFPTTSNISRSCPTFHNSLLNHTVTLWTPLLHIK